MKTRKPPSAKCPSCRSEEIDIALAGPWAEGHKWGIFQYGTCISCGTRCEHRSTQNEPSGQVRYTDRIVTEQEWIRLVGGSPEELEIRRLESEGPDISQDEDRAV